MAGSEGRRVGSQGALRAWLAWWALLAALWLVLIDNLDPPDLAAGAAAAAIAATAAVLVRAQRRALLRPRTRWLRVLPRVVIRTARDVGAVALAVWRRGVLRRGETGRLVEVPFAAVGDDGRSAARRVAAMTLGSFAAGTVVVDVDVRRRVLLAHALAEEDDGAVRAAADPLSALERQAPS